MIEFVAGMLMGIGGAVHCIGMCGPLVAFASTHSAEYGRSLSVILYHIGRTITYIALASVISGTRNIVAVDQYSSAITVVAGVMMIVVAIAQLAYHKNLLPVTYSRWITHRLTTATGYVKSIQGLQRNMLLGLLNGLLPCGLSLSAFVASMTLPNTWQVVLFMLGFGVGTAPGLAGVMFFGMRVLHPWFTRSAKLAPVLVVIAGTMILLRGLSLGIPWVSPQLNHASPHHTQQCCDAP